MHRKVEHCFVYFLEPCNACSLSPHIFHNWNPESSHIFSVGGELGLWWWGGGGGIHSLHSFVHTYLCSNCCPQVSWRSAHEEKKSVFSAAVIAAAKEAALSSGEKPATPAPEKPNSPQPEKPDSPPPEKPSTASWEGDLLGTNTATPCDKT